MSSRLQSLASADQLTARVSHFVSALDDSKREKATFSWNGSEWRSWNYFGGGGFIKPGLRLEEMNASERDATWNVLASVLSQSGLAKAKNVMLLQDILAAAGNGRGVRSSKRFSIAIFGISRARPDRWGLRLEGHHLSLSFAVGDNEIVSLTPAAFAALPNRVTSGRHRGLVTLQGEEKLARRLQADLAPKNREIVPSSATASCSTFCRRQGASAVTSRKVGTAAADMTAGQRDILRQLVETYAIEPYAGSLAEAQRARLERSDLAAVHFAWYGPNVAEQSFGYRIIADDFVVELGCIDSKAQHLHPVYHDLGNTLGSAA